MLVLCVLGSELRAPNAEAAFISTYVHDGTDLAGATGCARERRMKH